MGRGQQKQTGIGGRLGVESRLIGGEVKALSLRFSMSDGILRTISRLYLATFDAEIR